MEIYDMAGHLVRRIHQISVSVFAEHVARSGIDITQVQFAALYAVQAHPGIDQAGLASAIAYDRVTIGGVVDRLESKGLVTRSISPRDRRARELHVTERGGKAVEALLPIVRGVQDEILAGLSAAEREAFLALLRKVADTGNELSRAPLRGQSAPA